MYGLLISSKWVTKLCWDSCGSIDALGKANDTDIPWVHAIFKYLGCQERFGYLRAIVFTYKQAETCRWIMQKGKS